MSKLAIDEVTLNIASQWLSNFAPALELIKKASSVPETRERLTYQITRVKSFCNYFDATIAEAKAELAKQTL